MNSVIRLNKSHAAMLIVLSLTCMIGLVGLWGFGCSGGSSAEATPTPQNTPTPTPTPDPPLDYQISFLEFSEPSGISISENGPHGVIVADINGDDFEDVYITRCCDGQGDFLFVNRGDGSFEEESSQARGIGKPDSDIAGTHGAVFFDYDNDGDYDLLRSGTNMPNRLYQNDGKGFFTEVNAQAGFSMDEQEMRGVLAADIDLDNDLDVYMVSLACVGEMELFRNILMINNGDGTFSEDVDDVHGLADPAWAPGECRGSQGITVTDVENDGDPDIYVNRIDQQNRLWINDGFGLFTNEGKARGVGNYFIFTNGAVFADIDNDGDFDLMVQDLDEQYKLKFYRNDGKGYFQDVTDEYGLWSQAYSGLIADFDNDGDLDYYVIARGDEVHMIMLQNDGKGHFTEIRDCGADFIKNDARSAAALDYDNDGDLDIMLVANRGGSNFLRNEANNNRFLKIKLIGPNGMAGAFGAIVRIYQAGHVGEKAYFRGMRYAASTRGYLSQSSTVIHFGLGNITQIADVEVQFSNGKVVRRLGVERGSFITVRADE